MTLYLLNEWKRLHVKQNTEIIIGLCSNSLLRSLSGWFCMQGFFGYISQTWSGWNPKYKSLAHSRKKIRGKQSQGFHLRTPKCVLFIVTNKAGFRPLILHRFFRWIGVHIRTQVKNFRISAQGILQVPKTAKNGHFRGGACDKATAQMAQFRAMGIVSEPSGHSKDVPFVSFDGDVRFGC